MRRLTVPLLALALAGCGGGNEPAAPTPLQRELRALPGEMAVLHPKVDHTVPMKDLRREANELADRAPELSRDELAVGLMRFFVLGERDGHGGLFLFDPSHVRPFHFYPLRLHDFADGVHVVADEGGGHVGKKLASIDGVPLEDVIERVEPLVPRDNDSTVRLLLPEYLVCAEVLRGLGIVDGDATYAFADGSEVTLAPVDVHDYSLGTALHPLPVDGDPLLYRGLDQPFWLERLDGGRVLYLGFHTVEAPPDELLAEIRAAARKPGFRRLIVDTRQNGGGNNATYGPLLELMNEPQLKGKVAVLLGRMTFSAAGNFVASVDHETDAVLVGEPSGGAPNQYGDRIPIELKSAGLTAYVAAERVEVVPEDDRLAVEPDVHVEPEAADFLAGRDPVLEKALALP